MDDRDEALSLLLYGCRLARQFESNLPHSIQNHPRFLIPPCESIVRAFNEAMVLLGSHSHNPSPPSPPPPPPPPPAGNFLGKSLKQRQELVVAGSQDLLTGAHTRPLDLISFMGTTEAIGDVEAELEMGSSDSIITSSTVRGPFFQPKRMRGDGQETYKIITTSQSANPETVPDDGHNWRKYGQKDILGAKYPRSYYRCAYRHTRGCLAKKQVQRGDEEPSIFHVTYQSIHTCLTRETHVVEESTRAQAPPSISQTSSDLGGWVTTPAEPEVDQGDGKGPAETHTQEVRERGGGARVGEPLHVRKVNEMEGLFDINEDYMSDPGSCDNSYNN